MTEPTDKEKCLNIADQCTATASNDITASILVDGGSGTLRELLNDAADAIRAGWAAPQPTQAAESVLEDAARLERERICAAIKAEDDYCVDHGDYMLDSDDCIKIVRGEWVRPDFSVAAARKKGENHD